MEYEAVIGLETHVQLKTQSKMWCGCANAFGSDPNTNVCPICLGMPGVLPVPNAEAIRLTVLTGYLLNCEIPRFAKFDRKNYFYPDSAKNYQVTQYDKPSTANGWLEFEFDGPGSVDGMARVRITRAHLEEDVGKNSHFERFSGVDFNRAGVPLLEIVSEPELNGPEMTYAYLRALTDVLFRGGISDCDLEKGMVRCDVNVSVRPKGSTQLGAKIEIKNMNSFSGARRALEYEIPRQIAALKRGETLRQETRRWDDLAGITEAMRSKEDAHDYRYFPEPDLMPLVPNDEWLASVKAQVVELPLARKKRFIREYGLPDGDAATLEETGAPGLWGEAGYTSLERRWGRPTAEVNGIGGGYQGEGSKTVIGREAMAKLSFRLVPDQNPREILDLAAAHLRSVCPPSCRIEVELGHWGPAYVMDPHSAHGKAAQRALTRAFSGEPRLIREGGSIPIIQAIKDTLGVDSLLLGLALPDCQIHSPNENFTVSNFEAGIRLNQALLEELA